MEAVIDQLLLSKTVSHALRHEPWVYELELDEEGWVAISNLVESLRLEHRDWSELSANDLVAMVNATPKRRHEISEGRIRALYGHSIPSRLSRMRSRPPETLFHGTSPISIESIQKEGLKPMNRQNVHLSVDEATAREVGRRKSKDPIILRVNAAKAFELGVAFYEGNEKVWLADIVPSMFIQF